MKMICKGCGKTPDKIMEYVMLAVELDITPDEAVRTEEGTFNEKTGKFYCTECYIKAGQPLGKA